MEHFSFVLWVALWPLACTLESYITAKRRNITGEEQPTSRNKAFTAIIQIIIWIAVGKAIY